MQPSVVVISGKSKGSTAELSGSVVIGRDEIADLVLQDGLISRRHCRIAQSDNDFCLEDLRSTNGTFVNGIPVFSRNLHHGDLIEIGRSALLFMQEENLEQDPVLLSHTFEARTSPASGLVLGGLGAGISREIEALLRISTAGYEYSDPQSLFRFLLDEIQTLVPVVDGCFAAVDETGSPTLLARAPTAQQPLSFDELILLKAVREQVPTLGLVEGRPCLCTPVLNTAPPVVCELIGHPNLPFQQRHVDFVTATLQVARGAYERTRAIITLMRENAELQQQRDAQFQIIGESAPTKELLELIARVARTDSTVTISGESGTGKELIARAIHANSARAANPLVAINCAALPDALLESELFGHEKGAFTGAFAQKKGRLELANGGTVFLDEIGELALPLQAKLLRAVQQREFERLGGTRAVRVDVRVIAATNRNLSEEVRKGRFRPDLYYRLNVVTIEAPPLRNRKQDISILAHYFLAKYSRDCKRAVRGIHPGAMRLLTNHHWPGNVRELQNVIERAVVLGSTLELIPDDLPESIHDHVVNLDASEEGFHYTLANKKRELILAALQVQGGNYTAAAKQLRLHPNYLHRLIRNLGIKEVAKNCSSAGARIGDS